MRESANRSQLTSVYALLVGGIFGSSVTVALVLFILLISNNLNWVRNAMVGTLFVDIIALCVFLLSAFSRVRR